MGRTAPIHLSKDERDHVQVFVRRGKANARARVLLKSDTGFTNAELDRSQMEHYFTSFGKITPWT